MKFYKQADFTKKETWRKKSFAIARDKFIQKLDNNSMPFVEHCAKVIIFPNDVSVNKWEHEIYAKVNWIQTFELKGGKITKKLIKEHFFNPCSDFVSFKAFLDNTRHDCVSLYGYTNPVEYDSRINEIFNNYLKFCDKITDYLLAKKLTEDVFLRLAEQYVER